MCAGCHKQQGEGFIVLIPNDQPVRLQVAFPQTCVPTGQNMCFVLWWQFAFYLENFNCMFKFRKIVTSFFASFNILFESVGKPNGIHHCRHLSIRSFAFSASKTRPFFISSNASSIPFFFLTSVKATTSLSDSRSATSFFPDLVFSFMVILYVAII